MKDKFLPKLRAQLPPDERILWCGWPAGRAAPLVHFPIFYFFATLMILAAVPGLSQLERTLGCICCCLLIAFTDPFSQSEPQWLLVITDRRFLVYRKNVLLVRAQPLKMIELVRHGGNLVTITEHTEDGEITWRIAVDEQELRALSAELGTLGLPMDRRDL